MDQVERKLRIFYPKIALAREQNYPASRKRLDFMLNEYIDILLAMPRPTNERFGNRCCPLVRQPEPSPPAKPDWSLAYLDLEPGINDLDRWASDESQDCAPSARPALKKPSRPRR